MNNINIGRTRYHVPQPSTRGLKSPASQWCIQIEITNACGRSCSNCTRFTRLVTEPFFMPLDIFQRAVDSMHGYTGMLGVMGGEPTIHPQFHDLVLYYANHWNQDCSADRGRDPIEDFDRYYIKELSNPSGKKRGLWTSLGAGYYKHFEIIQDSFPYQCVNTHKNDAMHQALLTTRKELGIPTTEWTRMRDACWIQRMWSSSINPRGAYFCEIAAALDTLYASIPAHRRIELGMPAAGGWKIEPGWWRRGPSEFGEQLRWCEFCGAAFGTPAVLASECVQQVSQWHADRLLEIKSPILNKPVLKVLPGQPVGAAKLSKAKTNSDWYMPKKDKPLRASGHDLYPKKIELIIVSVDCADELSLTLPGRARQVDHCIVVTTPADKQTQTVATKAGASVVVSDGCYADRAAFNKGAMLNAGMAALKHKDWIILSDADIFFADTWRERLNKLVLNPGCLYYTRRWYLPKGTTQPDSNAVTDGHLLDPCGSDGPWGYFQLWNYGAGCLNATEFRFPLCFPSAGSVDQWFKFQWPANKIRHLPDDREFDVYHIWHGLLAERWGGRLASNKRLWQYIGQSDIHGYAPMLEQDYVGYWIKRVDMQTAVEETRFCDGRPITWLAGVRDNTTYSFSARMD